MKRKLLLIILSIFVLLCAAALVFADQKIKQRTTVGGQTIEKTVMIKGSRQRTENSMSGDAGKYMPKVATVTQCDLRRDLQINDAKKLYLIQPFADEAVENTSMSNGKTSVKTTSSGGTVTMTYIVTDTGERKQMFGLTARHLKIVMTSEPSANACNKNKMRMEMDGWYVDLPGFSCATRPQMPTMPQTRGGGCQDRMSFKTGGTGKMGFALTQTMTTFDANGKAQSTITTETIELSNATLDPALFDIPAGYSQANSMEDIYKVDMNAIMQQSDDEDSGKTVNSKPVNSNKSVNMKKAGMIRIGVLAVSNKTSESVSNENLRAFLIGKLTGGNVEAIAVNSETDARAMSCDYVLSADISKLKQSAASKVGGIFGRVTGTDTSGTQKFEAQVDYKLTTPDGQIAAQNKAAQKADGNAETAVEVVLSQVANAVISAAARKN